MLMQQRLQKQKNKNIKSHGLLFMGFYIFHKCANGDGSLWRIFGCATKNRPHWRTSIGTRTFLWYTMDNNDYFG